MMTVRRDREKEAQDYAIAASARQNTVPAGEDAGSDFNKGNYFQPSPAENLKTGALPTVCSEEDMRVSSAYVLSALQNLRCQTPTQHPHCPLTVSNLSQIHAKL